jgi:hypothetical protein
MHIDTDIATTRAGIETALRAIRCAATDGRLTCADAYAGPAHEPADLHLYDALDLCVRVGVLVRAAGYSEADHTTMGYVQGPTWSTLPAIIDALASHRCPVAVAWDDAIDFCGGV